MRGNATNQASCDAISAKSPSGGDLLLRRVFLGASASVPLLAVTDHVLAADPAPQSTPFDGSTVRNMARQLALQPYKAPENNLPAPFKTLDFEAYQGIRFDPSKALWRGQDRRFTAQFFHRGYIYPDRVNIFEVAGGKADPIKYNAGMFTFEKELPDAGDVGFA